MKRYTILILYNINTTKKGTIQFKTGRMVMIDVLYISKIQLIRVGTI